MSKLFLIVLMCVFGATLSLSGHVAAEDPVSKKALALADNIAKEGSAADGQELCIVGQTPSLAVLERIKNENVFVFQTLTDKSPIEAKKIVRWGHPKLSQGRAQVLLSDGTLITAAGIWTLPKEIQAKQFRLTNETLHVITESFGEIDIPRQFIASILLQSKQEEHAFKRLKEKTSSKKSSQDLLELTGGDQLKGSVLSLDSKNLLFQTASKKAKIKIESIAAVHFNTALLQRPEKNSPFILLGLEDGSLLSVKKMDANEQGNLISFTTLGEVNLELNGAKEIVYVQPILFGTNYLSDQKPNKFRHIPFLEIPWIYQMDRNVLGGPLRSKRKIYKKGIGVHSTTQLVFKLDPKAKRFVTQIAIDGASQKRGSVIFKVLLAKSGKWEEAYKSEVVRGGESPRRVEVPLSKAAGIALVVEYADQGDELDYANWLDPRLEQ